MKKAVQAVPNQRLKQARELHGWSQKYVAEQIGADHYYLSRWERGTAAPSPYYREKLCALFGKNARELGLLQHEPDENSIVTGGGEDEAAPVPAVSDPAIPLPSLHTTELVGRDDVLFQLKERLRLGKNLVLTALNGLPGVGKTTLAVALAHDSQVLEHFHDGVLWAGVGPHPNVIALLSRWGTMLGIAAVEMAKLTTPEAWAMALHAATGRRRMLLVIDDVWKIEDALAFKIGGSHCAYLVTTRFPSIAVQFAAEGTTMVHELSEDEGVTLLSRLVPELVSNDLQGARALVQLVGGLPLALTLIGKYLRTQAYSGQPRRLHAAMERLQRAEERLRLSEPRAWLEYPPGFSTDMPVSLQSIITVSEQPLHEQERLALRSLAVFPAKPNTFSEEAALAVSQAPLDVLDTLNDMGLVQSSEAGRYTLHQTIADYAKINLTDEAAYTRMIDYFANYVETHEKNWDALEQEATNIFAALQAAFERHYFTELIRLAHGLARFLEARGLFVQAELHLERAREAAASLHKISDLAASLFFLGEIAEKHGKYVQAEAYLQEGLTLARQSNNQMRRSDILRLLGLVASRRVDYIQAEAYLQEGLALARELGDNERISAVLRWLGSVVAEQGNYAQAEAYQQEGLALARQLGDLANISVQLSNLGAVAIEIRNYAQATIYLQEGLALARQAGHRQHASVLLTNLGIVARELGNHTQADAYFDEGLAIARQLGHRWFISAILSEWGQLHLRQQRIDAAYAEFKEALEQAPVDSRDRIADALYGLAGVALTQGDKTEARKLGQESLKIFEAIGHGKAREVRQWLNFP